MSEQDPNAEIMRETLEATAFIEAVGQIKSLFKAGNYIDRGIVNDRELLRLRNALNEFVLQLDEQKLQNPGR